MAFNKFQYLAFGAAYWWRRYIFRRKTPFIAGLVLNKSCNMHCEGCRVSEMNRASDPTRGEVKRAILELRRRGIRNLAITGGEPFLWESEGWQVSDVIRFARYNAFMAITVYTNGTLPFDNCEADTVFVSLHGIEKTGIDQNIAVSRQCFHNLQNIQM